MAVSVIPIDFVTDRSTKATAESRLATKLRERDVSVFDELISTYEAGVIGMARRVGTLLEPLDLLHEVLLKVWDAGDRFKGNDAQLTIYVMRTAFGTICRGGARERRFVPLDEDIRDGGVGQESRAILDEFLSLLDTRARICFENCYGGDLTDRDVADLLGISRSTVRKALTRAFRKVAMYRARMGIKVRP